VGIRGVQRDLVVTGFFFICNWLKFYKYKLDYNRKRRWKIEKHWGSAEFRAVSFCVGTFGWPTGCSSFGFGIGFEGASSGSAGLVAFWLFCVVIFGLSGMRSRLLGAEFSAWWDSEISALAWNIRYVVLVGRFSLSSWMMMSLWGLLCLMVCVWRVLRCVKSGQVCCCSFGGDIWDRCGFQCQELRWYVLGEFQFAAWCGRHNCFTSG